MPSIRIRLFLIFIMVMLFATQRALETRLIKTIREPILHLESWALNPDPYLIKFS
jgi:hypothetical protein